MDYIRANLLPESPCAWGLMVSVLLFGNPFIDAGLRRNVPRAVHLALVAFPHVCAYVFLCASPVFLLIPLFPVLALWPKLFTDKRRSQLPAVMQGHVGPFGPGGFKLLELGTITLVYPRCLQFGAGMPPLWICTFVVVGTIGTAVILHLWSDWAQSCGSHRGVQRMVGKHCKKVDDASSSDSTSSECDQTMKLQGRKKQVPQEKLTWEAMATLACFACGNALCEEAVSRGLFLYELRVLGHINPLVANLAQAASFGMQHFYGIPNGWSGVLLTLIYGFIMGYLTLEHGLALAVAAHAVADYYIFAYVARKQF